MDWCPLQLQLSVTHRTEIQVVRHLLYGCVIHANMLSRSERLDVTALSPAMWGDHVIIEIICVSMTVLSGGELEIVFKHKNKFFLFLCRMKHYNGHYSHSFMRHERSDCHVWAFDINKYDDIHVSKKIEIANECHSSVVPRKSKKIVKFCENSTNVDIFETDWCESCCLTSNMSHSNRLKDALRDIKLCITLETIWDFFMLDCRRRFRDFISPLRFAFRAKSAFNHRRPSRMKKSSFRSCVINNYYSNS